MLNVTLLLVDYTCVLNIGTVVLYLLRAVCYTHDSVIS